MGVYYQQGWYKTQSLKEHSAELELSLKQKDSFVSAVQVVPVSSSDQQVPNATNSLGTQASAQPSSEETILSTTTIERVELTAAQPVEMPKIELPNTDVTLPEYQSLKTQDEPELLQAGSATTVISGAQTSNDGQQLQVDPQVLQSVQQQTGIPTYELEQAFLQESE